MAFSIFQSREEKERKAAEYRKRLLPFGEAQQALERNLVNVCFSTSVMDENERFYELICVKDILLMPDETEKDKKRKKTAMEKWYNARLQKKLPEEDRQALIILAKMITQADSLESFPDKEKAAEMIKKGLPSEVENWF